MAANYDGVITPEQYLEQENEKRRITSPTYINPSSDMVADVRRGRYQECTVCGSLVTYGRGVQHQNFHKTFSNRRNDTMSEVKWCDYGNHAFKAGSIGSASFDGSQVNNDGKTVSETMDACRDHNPMKPLVDQAELKALTVQAYNELSPKKPYASESGHGAGTMASPYVD